MSTKASLRHNTNPARFTGVDIRTHTLTGEKRDAPLDDATNDPSCPDFNFYVECLEDDGAVYLELEECPGFPVWFATSPGSVCVKIPMAVWNRIVEVGKRKVEDEHS